MAYELELTRSIMGNENGRFAPVFVGGGYVNKNLPLFTHGLFLRLQRLVIAPKDFALGERHGEFEGLALGIALVREIGIDLVIGTHGELTISLFAGLLRVGLGRPGRRIWSSDESDDQ